MSNEITIKKTIITNLKNKELIVREFGKTTSEQFVRGYITGFSESLNVDIPCHWYDQIIEEIRKSQAA